MPLPGNQRPETPTMSYLRKVTAIVWKDIVAELRTKEMFSAMFVFAVLVIVIFNFAFDLRVSGERVRQVAPGALWVAFTFCRGAGPEPGLCHGKGSRLPGGPAAGAGRSLRPSTLAR